MRAKNAGNRGESQAADTTVVGQVQQHVKDLIARRDLVRDAQLPSYRELAAALSVGFTTVKLAMDGLVAQGVIRRQPAQGCFVQRELGRAGHKLHKMGIIYPASQRALFHSPYLQEILRGLSSDEEQLLDFHILSLRHHGLVSAAQIAEYHIDGVVLLGVENEEFLKAFVQWGVPGVVVDYVAPGLPLDCFACDNAAAARQAVAQLVALGHRRILYVDAPPVPNVQIAQTADRTLSLWSSDRIERLAAARAELAATPGLQWSVRCARPAQAAHRDPDAPFAALWAEVARRERPTAILTYDESVAKSLIRVLSEGVLRVPQDVSICAVAGAGEVDSDGSCVTQCRFDFVGMGRQAGELLKARCLKTDNSCPRTYRSGFQFLDGHTTAGAAARCWSRVNKNNRRQS